MDMTVMLKRKNIYFRPYLDRVLARRFDLGDERSVKIMQRVLALAESDKKELLSQVLRNYAKRHRSIVNVLERNFGLREHLLQKLPITKKEVSEIDRLLIGSYFTMEYTIESAAFFNPSIVLSPDQTQLNPGERRIILSFRAVGEGHLSSLVFRSGVIDENLDIHLEEIGNLLDKPRHVKNHIYKKNEFLGELCQLYQPEKAIRDQLEDKFPETFTYDELVRFAKEIKTESTLSLDGQVLIQQMMWLASSHYEIKYSLDTAISERVIFPISDTEKNGIEDARFVRFSSSKAPAVYFGTYTAYDGITILPKLISTQDFISFKIQPINGEIANKGVALFPRKIKGQYAMLCRIDGENNYITFSDDITNWHDEVHLLTEPEFPWEFVQLGNCGSPIETNVGWLVILHAVGPMREYTMGAMLLDLEDPRKVIGKLKRPLLYPNGEERNGYVPNVVYSCGQMLHQDHLIIPYGFSDHESTYATVPIQELLTELLAG